MHKIALRQFIGLAAVCLIWGTTWVAIKYSLEGIPPFLGAMLRFAVAGACLYLYARARKISLRLSPGDFKYVFLSALFLYPLDYGLIYLGEQYLYSGVTAVFFATFPLFTGLISIFAFRSESFGWRKFAGFVLALGGTAVIYYDQLLITRFGGAVFWASAAIVLSALTGAISLVVVKKYLPHVTPVSLSLHQMLQGVVMLVLVGLMRGETWQGLPSVRTVAAVIYLGVFGSAIAFVIYYSLLRTMSAASLSGITYVTPLVAIATGWLLQDEAITVRIVCGTLIVFGGIAISHVKGPGKAAIRDAQPVI
jgi:drug/metabolite transporter (DMT)-like permease